MRIYHLTDHDLLQLALRCPGGCKHPPGEHLDAVDPLGQDPVSLKALIITLICPQVTGGRFTQNGADNGGVLFASGGSANAMCKGATIQDNEAGNGGAIYITGDAVLKWGYDLIMNNACSGGAM